jgi:hypothetical protein
MAEAAACQVDCSRAWNSRLMAHNPIDDASTQARAVILARKGLRAGREVPV